jgi:predicted regulator of Ras-like GTPase activity (Roadblock/LC7/MglB family)
MTIPFVDLLKKVTARFIEVRANSASTPIQAVRAKKPSEQRLSKTILPNATRSLTPARDPFRTAAGSAASVKPIGSLRLGTNKIFSGATASAASRSRDLPPALAQALEPKLERAISLQLADFLHQVPVGYIKPVEIIDARLHVSLKASEIEKGMPDGKPSISLPSLYQQVPEIFLRSVPSDDQTRVALPFEKVLEQFKNARVRADQLRDPAIPQLDSPILQATIEDTERFGTKVERLESSVLPPVHVAPATAKNIADAEPEPAAEETVRSTSPTSTSPAHPVISLHSPDLAPKKAPLPFKIPFQLPPNGTGAPASERVPASSGPPVPLSLPLPPGLEHAPFHQAPEPVDAKISAAIEASTGEPADAEKIPALEDASAPALHATDLSSDLDLNEIALGRSEPKISLALRPLLRNVPEFQLNGDIASVPEDARVELALSLIEPQLASGRVTVSPQLFQAVIPSNHRNLFCPDEANTPVLLPLEEVLKNLPATVLKLRDDQEDIVTDKDFETPFSVEAQEDAKRLQGPATPDLKISDKTAEQTSVEKNIEIKVEEKIDAKEIVARAHLLPGVKACAITFFDGLSLAGSLPPEVEADGLCAMAPLLLERTDKHMRESKLGPLVAMSLHSEDSGISFFPRENICLAVLHAEEVLPPVTRAQLAELVEKLSRTYTQPETLHVDH